MVFGCSGIALDWFRSYFRDQIQFIAMNYMNWCSAGFGPWPFSFFSLGQLLRSLGLNYFYADDMQICIHSKSGQSVDVSYLCNFLSEIKTWMANNFLYLNSSKMEIMLLGSPHQLRSTSAITLSIDGSVLEPQDKLKNLS